jgi:hypothetical protein
MDPEESEALMTQVMTEIAVDGFHQTVRDFVTAVEAIAKTMAENTELARESLDLQRRALLTNEQMVATSKALEEDLTRRMTGGKS